jgi:hypothetical protein
MKNRPPLFESRFFYGQLQHIFVLDIPGYNLMNPGPAETLVLAAISQCEVDRSTTTSANLPGVTYYSHIGPLEVVDIETIQCLVGRIDCDRNRRVVIDRDGALTRPGPAQ